MSLASITQGCKITGTSMQLYLFAYPTAGYTGTGLAGKLADIYQNVYTTGKTGDPILEQWALLDSNGVNFKYKADTIMVDTNNLGKIPAGYGPPEITIEGNCVDADAAHMKDILSSTSGEILGTSAAAGVYGSSAVAFGSARRVAYYGAIIRWLSPTVTTGTATAWDHIVIPRLAINPEMDLKFNRKDATLAKFAFMVLPDATIVSPDSTAAVAGFYDSATAPAT